MATNTTEGKASAEALLVETGEQRDRLSRRITPVARRVDLVAAWRESGLTQAEFARREGFNYSSFAAWVQAARLQAIAATVGKPTRASVRFVEASLPSRAYEQLRSLRFVLSKKMAMNPKPGASQILAFVGLPLAGRPGHATMVPGGTPTSGGPTGQKPRVARN